MAFFANSKFVEELTPDDFDERERWRLKRKRCCIVLFYLRECPHCIAVKEVWRKLAERAAFYDVCAFDAASYPEYTNALRNDMPGLIKGYPTMIIYERGELKENYVGPRTVTDLTNALMRSCSSSN